MQSSIQKYSGMKRKWLYWLLKRPKRVSEQQMAKGQTASELNHGQSWTPQRQRRQWCCAPCVALFGSVKCHKLQTLSVMPYLCITPCKFSFCKQPKQTNIHFHAVAAKHGQSLCTWVSQREHLRSEFKSVAEQTANTNNLCRNSIASGYDLQSLDFLGSCQEQVASLKASYIFFLYLPNWNSICFNGSSN